MDDCSLVCPCESETRRRGDMQLLKRPVAPYVVALDEDELRSYHRLRINSSTYEHSESLS